MAGGGGSGAGGSVRLAGYKLYGPSNQIVVYGDRLRDPPELALVITEAQDAATNPVASLVNTTDFGFVIINATCGGFILRRRFMQLHLRQPSVASFAVMDLASFPPSPAVSSHQ